MRIERVNDTTLKFYLTYADIEARGFKRDELWTSRKAGEAFFWSIMEEVNEEEDFFIEGPLWIQVHAFDKGIEFVVTKSKQGEGIHLPEDESSEQLEYHVHDFLNKSMQDEKELRELLMKAAHINDIENEFVVHFKSLEDVIMFSYDASIDVDIEDLLYMYDGKYYYFVKFDERMTDDAVHTYVAHILEYANETRISKEQLEEYGKVVMSYNVKRQVRKYFKQ
ncbi:adaptor protein MecA [Macrococcoides caseolyticum]|uniref:adaptor protein MecA n=1 Tax=Macrococcoides caseolyticum TaxID=69966 RepID=UPI001F2D8FC5|nr:adaptor protein MecA [Macrococcus caseolyticus]MCE4955729.1 adaptor protein MecA [Macrococcus caseolyticus]